MSNLAFCAAPIENINETDIKQNKRGRNPSRRRRNNTTMKFRNSNIQKNTSKNIIDEIHSNLNHELGSSSNLMDFQPISPPQIHYDMVEEHDPNKTIKRPRTPTRDTISQSGIPGDTFGGPIASSHYPSLEFGEPEAYLEETNNKKNTHPISKNKTTQSSQNSNSENHSDNLQHQSSQINQINTDREELMRKLNYMIQLLEENHDERTGHVTEEVLLYSFLGIFIIFVVDSFARAGKYVR